MKKILIAIPCMDQVPALFCLSLASLQKIYECHITGKIGSLIHMSRNDIATTAMRDGYDYVFWLDSDMVFRPDTLIRMVQTLESNDLDFLTGLYFRRVPMYTPVLFDELDFDGKKCNWTEFKTLPTELFEVGGCGFGCVLMKTDVFFDVCGRFHEMFEPIGWNGEDIAFCWRARKCGYKIWCDPSIICGHVGYSVVDDQFFMAFRDKDK